MTYLRKLYIELCQKESTILLSAEELKKNRQNFLNPLPDNDLLTHEYYEEIYK